MAAAGKIYLSAIMVCLVTVITDLPDFVEMDFDASGSAGVRDVLLLALTATTATAAACLFRTLAVPLPQASLTRGM